jgi:hypothetical protein
MLAPLVSPRGTSLAVAAVALAIASSACNRERGIDGVAGYSLVNTTLGDAKGVCSAEGEVTWCHSNPGISFGQQRASVDLYFRGEGDDAPLVEILLAINACRPAGVEGILSEQLGKPDERRGSVLRWNGVYAVTIAQLDVDRSGCEINIVSPSDEERIESLLTAKARSGGDSREDE